MKKIGLMGCGVVATYGHVPAIRSVTDLSLTALYDPNPRQLEKLQESSGVAAGFTDLDQFLSSGLDAVAITSPAPTHRANVLAAVARGLDVLCEKPLAMTVQEGREMSDAANARGVLLATGFDYRFSPAADEIRRLVREGAIGPVRSLRLIYIWNCHGKYAIGPDGHRIESPRRAGRMREGGPIVDCGVHQIDLARWWLGSEVVRWAAHGAWVDQYEAPDHVWLHMDHHSGAHTLVEISYSYCHTAAQPLSSFTYELIGTDGVIRYDRGAKIFEVRNGEGTTVLPFAPEKNFAGLYAAFARAMDTRELGPLPSAQDGIAADLIARSAVEQLVAQRATQKLPTGAGAAAVVHSSA
jgi:predicted dehydrogenase